MQSIRESSLPTVNLLKSCAKRKDLYKGTLVHVDLLERTDLLEKCPYVGSSLVSMYAKCGALGKSREVFDKIQVRNVVCWNALIGAYVHQGHSKQALLLFNKMKKDGFSPDAITYICILKSCGNIKDVEKGKKIHDEVVTSGFFGKDVTIGNALVDMYVKCGFLNIAEKVFDELYNRTVVCFNVLISGYAQNCQGEKALKYFERMKEEGLSPNAITYICTLKACAIIRDVEKGKSIHDEIVEHGFCGNDVMLGSALINMYAKCGGLHKAKQVLNDLVVRNVVCWNALLAGYGQHGQGEEALKCFERMQKEGFVPNAITYLCILKACAITGNLEKGNQVHDEIIRKRLLGRNMSLGTALIAMYAKCGALEKAEQIFDDIPVRKVVSWNALMSGYAQQGQGEQALRCFERMQKEGFPPNSVTYICVLKACANIENVYKGEQIHEKLCKDGFSVTDIFIGTALLDMYAKCGAVEKAKEVFDNLPVRNVVSWNALIAGYTLHGKSENALQLFEQMQKENLSPDEVTYICALKACVRMGALNKGKQLHDEIIKKRLLSSNISLATALVDMYAKCGALEKAEEVFDELPIRKVVCWNALIAGYSQEGQGEQALDCFQRMQKEGFSPNAITYICILKACSSVGEIDKGKQIHDEILSNGLLKKDIVLGTALIDMYAKCGALEKAKQVFNKLSVRNLICWNALIAGYAQQGYGEETLNLFECMLKAGFYPDDVTYICVLKACGIICALDRGKQIHDEILRNKLLGSNISLTTALVDMYCKCGALAKAEQVFDELSVRNVVCWNVLISGYTQQGKNEEALDCFEQMQTEGISPDPTTFSYILRACAVTGAVEKGKHMHDQIVRDKLIEKHSSLGTSLVDMYAKFGEMEKAEQVFNCLIVRDVACWTALIAGYVHQDKGEEALDCFEHMHEAGSAPDAFTLSCILKACASIGAVSMGQKIHEDIIQNQLLEENDVVLGTALLDMYAKCGELEKAEQVFETLPSQTLACWNALIAGYAQQGLGDETLNMFERMQEKGFTPDSSTFVCVLNACSHSGLMEIGEKYFMDMTEKYGLTPSLDHHTCMVDLFGRAGHVEKALELVKNIPSYGNLPLWLALLGSCRNWGNIDVSRLAFEQAIQFNCTSSAPYVLMINIYVAAGMKEDAEKIEMMRVRNIGVKRTRE